MAEPDHQHEQAPRPSPGTRADPVWQGLSPEFVRAAAAERLAAIAHPDRLRIVELLASGPANVSTLARQLGMSVNSTSRHLRALHSSDVVVSSRRGNRMLYALADRDVARLAAVAYRGAGTQVHRELEVGRPSKLAAIHGQRPA